MLDTGNLSWLQSSSSDATTDKTRLSLHRDTAAGAGDAVVMVNGALVNISSVLQNLSKSEEARAQTDNELKMMEQECCLYHFLSSVSFSHFT